jgi:hypothetical protein
MKKAVLIVLSLAPVLALAQSGSGTPAPSGTIQTSVNFPVERLQMPTMADLYCAGFVSKPIAKNRFVTGGLESPSTTRYANSEAIYLSGKGYELGQEFTIVRELVDPNRYELFKGQFAAQKAAGQAYEELARVKVIDIRGKMAITQVQYSCDTIVPGDYAIPYAQKPAVAFHEPMHIDRFVPSSGQVSGRIFLAKEFDSELGTSAKVYINIGSSQGLKVGDYLRAVRTYNADAHNPVDSLSFKASSNEVTQKHQASVDANLLTRTSGPEIHTTDMPRRAVGEIVVLSTTPGTATGMIVFAMEPVHVGDGVELDPQ